MRTMYPLGTFAAFNREMDGFLGSLLSELQGSNPFQKETRAFRQNGSGTLNVPAITAWENDETMHLEAELPGLAMEDLEITVVGDQLTITGELKNRLEADARVLRRERGIGRFTRTITLPYAVNAENVDATLKDGILTVRLPKSETAKPRKITVKRA